MAATTSVGNIEGQKRLREFVLDQIAKLDPYGERPILDMIGRVDVDNPKVEWTEQAMKTPSATNSNVHGFAHSFSLTDNNKRTEYFNYTQLMDAPVSVDKSAQAAKFYGVPKGGELAYQKELSYQALLNDVEAMLISANARVQPAPESNTAGVSGGVRTFISTNTIAAGAGNYPETYLKQSYFDDLVGGCKKLGGRPNLVLGGVQANRDISGWVSQADREVSDQGTVLTNLVTRYRSVAGTQDVMVHPQLTNVVLTLDTNRLKTAWLREPQWDEYPMGISDIDAGVYKAECSLIVQNEKAHGIITGLNYTA